jgi:hypothetical protein
MSEMRGSRTHDYTHRYWGHDYLFHPPEVIGSQKARLVGWGRWVEAGDYLLLQNGSDTERYRVCEIEYETDPPNMWVAEVSLTSRE